ncbi:MAG: glycoside hydrolase family 3 C-terminal domain-containing protein [Xanthomonadales bacterium]
MTAALLPLTAATENTAMQDPDTYREAVLDRRLAAVETEVESLLAQLTLDEKISLLHADGKFVVNAIERLGIHELWMSDGPHGVRQEINRDDWDPAGWDNDVATYLPPTTMVAASWNRDMARLHGTVLGAEARHRNKDLILGPGVNLARLPINGRNFEYLGEDPYNDVAATIKHYALNTQELNRRGVDSRPDERTLREVYLPMYEAAVKEAGVWAVMGAYNSYMGTNANQSRHLVMDILKGEWGFQGVLLTDWHVPINTYDAAMNGLDIEMGTDAPYNEFHFADPLKAMVQEGRVPESVIDDKVRRILRLQLSIGMMDRYRLQGQRNTPEHRAAALDIAREGVTLLKNDAGVLPLDASKTKKVLMIGPNVHREHAMGGGSSHIKALYEITPYQGVADRLGDGVEITTMRARGSTLSPIAGEYLASQHWTGTPTWEVDHYADAARSEHVAHSVISDSAFRVAEPGTPEHVTFRGVIAPLESGAHELKANATGAFQLEIDGETVLDFTAGEAETRTHAVDLEAGKTYEFAIHYSGAEGFTLGWDAPSDLFTPEAQYLAAARTADTVIFVGGLSHDDDREAVDRRNLELPGGQDEVIAKLLEANPNTVILLLGGSPAEMPWIDRAQAVVWGWYGGQEGGRAYAEVLFGDVNPSGKLPMTFPVRLEDSAPIALDDYGPEVANYPEGVFIGYRWYEQQGITPLFPFGHGLSYTTFEYSDLEIATPDAGDAVAIVAVTVTNTGKRAGAEAVQLYLGDVEASVERPAKELRGFAKVFLQPGESRRVEMPLSRRDLSFWDVENSGWKAEPGAFQVMLGASVADIRLRERFTYRPR